MLALIMDDRQGIEEALVSGILAQDKGSDKYYFVYDHFKVAATYLLPNKNHRKHCIYMSQENYYSYVEQLILVIVLLMLPTCITR